MDSTKKCPYCAEEINSDALKCKHCGEFLDESLRNYRQAQNSQNLVSNSKERKWSPGVAGLLSFLIPGAGQMYKGKVGVGILWLIAVVIGYSALIAPGVILHLICIFNATSGNPYKEY